MPSGFDRHHSSSEGETFLAADAIDERVLLGKKQCRKGAAAAC